MKNQDPEQLKKLAADYVQEFVYPKGLRYFWIQVSSDNLYCPEIKESLSQPPNDIVIYSWRELKKLEVLKVSLDLFTDTVLVEYRITILAGDVIRGLPSVNNKQIVAIARCHCYLDFCESGSPYVSDRDIEQISIESSRVVK